MTNTDDVVERVARAIYGDLWDEYENVDQEYIRDKMLASARAAIGAMRETLPVALAAPEGVEMDLSPGYITYQPAPSGWQPIESAPRDGSNILICGFSPKYYVADVRWNENESEFCLFHPDDDCHSTPTYNPKYWQPLPAPPVSQLSEGLDAALCDELDHGPGAIMREEGE